MDTTLEQVVRQYVHLPHYTNSKGWYQVLCKVCNDHGKKGKRAGFRFDGGLTSYNCFNCAHAAVYDPLTNRTIPDKMLEVLTSFGISSEDIDKVIFSAFQAAQSGDTAPERTKAMSIEPPVVPLPTHFERLEDKEDDVHQYAIEYLTNERLVDWKYQPFYVGVMTTHPDAERWFCRLVIPIYKDGKLIFYQGRDLTGKRPRKYLNLSVERENVLYGYEKLFTSTDQPLYIVEGWFDAYHLDGVAVLTNRFTDGHIKWLTKSPRQKVIVPDQFGNGHILAEKALNLGWSISTPDIGDCKDVNDAVAKYGKLYTLNTIREQTASGVEGLVKVKVYCKNSSDNDDSRGKRFHSKTPRK